MLFSLLILGRLLFLFVIAFDFTNRLSADTEILIGQFLDNDSEELHRDVGNLGRSGREPPDEMCLLLICQLSAFNRNVWHNIFTYQ